MPRTIRFSRRPSADAIADEYPVLSRGDQYEIVQFQGGSLVVAP